MAAVAETGFVLVGRPEDVPVLEGRRVTIDGRAIAVFRLADGTFRAVDGACPHAGGPLQDGIVGDGCVTCPLHNRRYALDELAGHEVEVRDGALWVRPAA